MPRTIMEINHEVREAFASGITRPYEWRLGQLRKVSSLLEEQEAVMVKALHEDLGKPAFEVRYTELDVVRNSCDYMVKELKRLMQPAKAKLPWYLAGSKAELVPEPLGAALIFSAWNYPFLLALDPLIAALAAGNTVVLKPSELAPATSALRARLIPQYLDPRAVKVVQGGERENTALLNEKWDKLFFTGNARIGKVVMAAAAQHLTPVTLELGGKCPTLVDDTADLDLAARRIASAKWACNAGQACVAPDYVLVQRKVAGRLIEALRKALTDFKLEDVSEQTARIVNLKQYRRLAGMIDEAQQLRGELGVLQHGGHGDEQGLRMQPTILLNPSLQSQVMNEEIFGPILPVLEMDGMGAAMAFVNSKPKPLALYLFSKSKATVEEVSLRTSSGALVVNDVATHFSLESIPFGGVGESGMGSYHGEYGFHTFSHKKPVVCAEGDSRIRYPPYSPKNQTLLSALLRHQNLKFVLVSLGLRKA